MKSTFNQTIIELVTGDITEEETDAIVNAANSRLAGGPVWTAPSTGPADRQL